MLKDFLFMVIGNAIFYEMLFKMSDLGERKKIFGIEFQSDFTFVLFFSFLTIPVMYIGSIIFNYAYLKQGLAHGENLWFPQFMVWCAAPTAFTILSTFQRGAPIEWRTIISLTLLFTAMLVRYYKA